MGTSVGSLVFVNHGWRPAAGLGLGWEGFCLLVLLARGPNAGRYTWIGWEGGWRRLRRPSNTTGPEDLEQASNGIGKENPVEVDEKKETVVDSHQVDSKGPEKQEYSRG